MGRHRRERFKASYSAVTSTLALFVALGGTGYAAAVIGADDIKDDAVHSRHVQDDEISSADVRDAVRANNGLNLMVGGLETRDLSDRLITAPKLASNAVTTDKIANNAVAREHLGHQVVMANHMRPGSVRGGHGGTVTDESIDSWDLAEGSVFGEEIADKAIEARHIGGGLPRTYLGFGFEKVHTHVWDRADRRVSVVAECPPGGEVVGGGGAYDSRGDVLDSTVVTNEPSGESWLFEVENPNNDELDVRAVAICLMGDEDDGPSLPDTGAP